ncbi:hypothetical protein NG798_04140 [Ancylothrix sp. C2]|uniref:hypothetical protein n=1 Tax=Ancylothrix sp. D3o TaxID=2953691 RepID=UPI0021BA92B9|nr:hypothetical protein [Ancylothrix sp. D3o]MCT7948968.1 hypothetical protein [Ancylothrix sp. D3o]
MMSYKGTRVLGLVFLAVFLAFGDAVLGGSVNFRPVMAQSTKQSQQTDRQAIQALINRQLKATNEENLQGIRDTYHPNSSEMDKMEPLLQQIFKAADIKTEVNKTEFLKISANEAIVRLTLTGRKIRGPQEFRNNRSVVRCNLQKYNGQWKFYSSQLEKIEYLD